MSAREKKKQPIVVQMGAPEWMVTFGDLMSLLLTFFVLLFSISEVKDQKIFDMVVAFRSEFELESDGDGAFLLDFSEVVELLSSLSKQMPDKAEGQMGKTNVRIENPFGEFASIHRVKEDFHIDVEGDVLFPEGSSEIGEQGRALLGDLSKRLRGGYNRIRVVGSAAPTNADTDEVLLGFQRARAVQELLILGTDGDGVDARRIEIATRGAFDPLTLPELIDPQKRGVRDRVVIILTPETVEEMFEAKSPRASLDPKVEEK